MEKLKKARTPLRSSFTRTLTELENELVSTTPDFDQLHLKLEKADRIMVEIADLDSRILDAMLDSECTDEVYARERTVIEEYQDKLSVIRFKVNKKISRSRESSPGTSVVTTMKKKSFRLPEIELPKFNGDLREWLGFWALFQKIHEDEEVEQSDKLHYLLQAMEKGSRARDVVESYPQTAENYPKVIAALKSRFGREELLVEVYVRELLKLVVNNVSHSKEKFVLAKMYDQLESHLRALESLGVTLDKNAAMLFPMVESSLPESLLIAWQRSPLSTRDGSIEDPPRSRLSYLMEFLKGEVEGEERISLARAGFGLLAVKNKTKAGKEQNEETATPTAAGLFSGEGDSKSKQHLCVFCGKAHESKDCFKAQSMTLEDRRAIVKTKKCCYACLRLNHVARFCKIPVRCQICKKRHYPLMCPELITFQEQKAGDKSHHVRDSQKADGNPESKSVQNSLTNQTCTRNVILQTVMVKIVGRRGEKLARALIDTGSQRSYILRRTADKMGCERLSEESIVHSLFGGINSKQVQHHRYQVVLRHVDQVFQMKLEMLDQGIICGRIPQVDNTLCTEELRAQGVCLNDCGPGSKEIEILFGADIAGQLLTGKMRQLPSGLTALETHFGWTVMGRSPLEQADSLSMTVTSMLVQEAAVPDLWKLEVIGICDPVEQKSRKEADEFAWRQFLTTVTRTSDGRYEVGLPWIEDQKTASSMVDIAKKRLYSVTRMLLASGRMHDYQAVFEEWLREGIIEEVPYEEYDCECNYLPHRPVFKEESSTTKVRPVFDASCKRAREPSLNECLEKGPNLLEMIPAILTRFREKTIGVTADIRKAFLMISVRAQDRDYLRFLWWKNYEEQSLAVYRHKRVVFGVNCSPFLLLAVIKYHLSRMPTDKKQVADQLLRSFYVDNCVTSVDTKEQLAIFIEEATALMANAKFELRMWLHNDTVTSKEEEEPVTVLGLKWNRVQDALFCETQNVVIPAVCSKRHILSVVQCIYDPLGFLSPATLIPKLLLQQTWAKKLSWDQEVSPEIREKFQKWANEVPSLASVVVPRLATRGQRECWSLHTFCDASKVAYAAVVFLRCDTAESTYVQLLQSKSRVVPLKKTTIPRLELLACTIGSRLAQSVKAALDFNGNPEFYWTDSTTALAWIRRNNDWGTFVGNRVREILSLTEPDDWRYVPGPLNPADLPSRGCRPSQLASSRWWEGPCWLRQDEKDWPRMDEDIDEKAVNSERKGPSLASIVVLDGALPWYMKCGLSYTRVVRIISWVLRFIRNLRDNKQRCTGEILKAHEIEAAEKSLVKLVQREVFTKPDIVQGLDVTTDGDNVIRVKTKITTRDDAHDFLFPMLLPAKHPLVGALILEVHQANSHAGPQFLMTKLRERFWILQSRRSIKSVIHKCVKCRRFDAKGIKTDPVPLPFDRVKTAAVFEVVGVDLAGPLYLKGGEKVWLVIYTCAVYRAVHLELVTSASTEAFLQSFRRFVARRGRPSIIYSDNGSNFVGTANLFKTLDWKKIATETAVERINWKFNPPTAAWWGGWWERLIRTIKSLLLRVLGRSSLTYEDLLTVICEVEAVVNGRPLTYVSEDSKDLVPLTPSMFIQEIKEVGVPEVDLLEGNEFRRRFRYRQKLREELRSRFRKEYLGQLVQRVKEHSKSRGLKVGEVVLIEADNKKRLLWPLGRITRLIPGRDGCSRVAYVRTSSGVLMRPVQKLYPMEVMQEDLDSQEGHMRQTQKEQDSERQSIHQDKEQRVVLTRAGRVVKPPERYGL